MPKSVSPVRMSVQDAIEAYPDEWVLMDTGAEPRPTNFVDVTGEIVCHDPDRRKVDALAFKLIKQNRQRGSSYFLFEAILPITTGEEARRVLAELRAKGEPFGFRRW